MANWGALMGLGEGMTQLGGQVFKAKFLDKLKEEEAVRAEKRKEAKDANTVKEQKYVNRDGVWYEQDISLGTGRPIEERLAPKSKIDEFNRASEKERLGLEEAVLKVGKAKREEGYAAEDRALDLEGAKAKIAESAADARLKDAQAGYYASGGGSGARASAEAEAAGPEDYVQELIKQSADLKKQYTAGKEPKLSPGEFQEAARAAVTEGARRGMDPRQLLAETLRRFERMRAKKYTRADRGIEAAVTEEDELE